MDTVNADKTDPSGGGKEERVGRDRRHQANKRGRSGSGLRL